MNKAAALSGARSETLTLPPLIASFMPLTAGTWVLREGGEPVAVESWRREDTPDGPEWRSHIRSSFPWPHEARLHLALDPQLRWRFLRIETQREGEDASTAYEGRPEGNLWVGTRTAEGEEAHGFYAWDARSELDFPSPLFNTVTLLRLGLEVGDAREVEAYMLEPFAYATGKVRQGYERLPDEEIRVAAGTFRARRYRYINALSGFVGDVWTDEACGVLRYGTSWELVEATPAAHPSL